MDKVQILRITEGFIIIIGLYFLGQLISRISPIPLPGNIIGLIIMVLFLILGIIPLQKVEEFADLLLDNIILIFIPLNISLITIWPILKTEGLGIFLINIVSTLLSLSVTSLIVDRFSKEGEEKNVN